MIGYRAAGVWNADGDADWFAITLQANQSYTFTLTAPNNTSGTLDLYSGAGVFSASLGYAYGISANAVGTTTGTYTPRTTGTYYIAAASVGGTGAYSLTAVPIADDFPDNPATSGIITVGGSATGVINAGGDADWFAISLTANQSYAFTVTGVSPLVPALALFDASGTELGYSVFAGGQQVATVTPAQTGTYYVAASGSGSGGYTVTATAIADDRVNSAATTGSLAVGGAVNGVWGVAGDDDWFAVNLTAGLSYRATLTEAISGAGAVHFVTAATGSGPGTGYDSTYSGSATATFSPSQSGTYFVSAQSYDAAGGYTLALATYADDASGSIATARTVAVGDTITGTFEVAGDSDWFRVNLVANQSYQVSSLSSAGFVTLHDQAGAVAGTSVYGNNASFFTAPTTGTYYLEGAGGVGPYSATLTTAADDFTDNPATTGTLGVGGTRAGVLNAAYDVDWFAVTLTAGLLYKLTLSGAGTLGGADAGFINPGADYPPSAFTPATSGTYYVAVSSQGGVGAYTIGLSAVADDFQDNPGTTGAFLLDTGATSGADTIQGTQGADSIDGLAGADSISGSDGNDTIDGGTGSDTLRGGAGNDVLRAGDTTADSNDLLFGDAGDDDLSGRTAASPSGPYILLDGGAGNDTIHGFGRFENFADYSSRTGPVVAVLGAGGATLPGGEADVFDQVVSFRGSPGADTVTGGVANDRIDLGAGGADSADGGAGTDRVDYLTYPLPGGAPSDGAGVRVDLSTGRATVGGAVQTLANFENIGGSDFDDVLIGNDADNDFRPVRGADTIDGRGGFDIVQYTTRGFFYSSIPAGVTINLQTGIGIDPWGFQDLYTSIEAARGTNLADSIGGSADANLLGGNGGNDTLRGAAGSDTLEGNDGNDSLDGGADADSLYGGAGNDTLIGGGGNDELRGGAGVDFYDGGDGFDLISFAPYSTETAPTQGVVASLLTGTIANDGFGNADSILGGAANTVEMLIGYSFNDDLTGRPNTTPGSFGTTGPGFVRGAQGNDTLRAAVADSRNVAADYLRDADLNADGLGVSVNLLTQTATDGWGGTDTLVNIGAVRGSAFADSLAGNDNANWFRPEGGNDTVTGGLGTDFLSLSDSPGAVVLNLATGVAQDGWGGTDSISGIEQASGSEVAGDTLIGDGADNLFYGYGGDDSLGGGAGADTLIGDIGRDTLRGGAGADSLDGGAGYDVLVLDQGRKLYGLALSDGGQNTGLISPTNVPYAGIAAAGTATTAGVVDSFTGIEAIQFADGRLVFDPGDTIGQVARLYYAALGRAPDALGLNFWADYINAGNPLSSLAQAFVGSLEFQLRYPAVDNTGFVTLLYQNTLGRAPDQAGLDAWVAVLNGGTSQADLLRFFSESAEHYNHTASIWTNGIWDLNETGASVARLYLAALGRSPDAGGWQYWNDQVTTGALSLHDLAAAFPASAEFQARYPQVNNTGYVTLLYQNTLGRAPDQAGLNAWLAVLDAGSLDRVGLLQAFADSLENKLHTIDLIEGGITFV